MNLETHITEVFRLNEKQKNALKKIGLITIEDLLFYFPSRYGNQVKAKNISELQNDELALIYGRLKKIETGKAFIKKTPIAKGVIEDETGAIKAVWFHQPYIAKLIKEGSMVKIQGKVSLKNGSWSMTNPEIETVKDLPISVGETLFGEDNSGFPLPVYPESRGITSKWIFHAMQKIFKQDILKEINDPIPQRILEKYNLPSIKTALVWIHYPQKESDAKAARKRFAFQEIFLIQILKQKERSEYRQKESFKIFKPRHEIEDFLKRFPFEPTNAQKNSVERILNDFERDYPMSRLLEGDVGSGKTAVAATAVYAVASTKPKADKGFLQTAYMAPTEILIEQQFETFVKYFSYLNINIGLITGSGCKKFPSKLNPNKATKISRSQLLKWTAEGDIAVVFGTHSLIQKSVKFRNLGFVIIDEQHRFGTNQRRKLKSKDARTPHLLSMTATPIPRTLALTIYGDLDLTLIDEMPKGRKQVITEIVLPGDRNNTYEKIRKELESGRQAYVICPRIEEADPNKFLALNVKSVKEEAKKLKKEVFQKYNIDILHSKMRPAEKEKVMNDFKEKKIDILVATSVVEVGVNVPNATVIVIEGAERFGLAQLHQLRGRVLRSEHQAYCFVFTDTKQEKSLERLNSLKLAKNGFELAEFDLNQRGAGEIYGRKQWGITDLGMEAIQNIKMVEAARNEAEEIIKIDPELSRYESVLKKIEKNKDTMHFE